MQPDGAAGRFARRPALRQQRAAQAGEGVAAAAGGQARIAVGIDDGDRARRGDDAARPFEYHHRLIALGQFLGGRQAVLLHFGGAAGEQARSFQRVRGHDGGVAARPARRQPRRQVDAGGNQVQAVGVEHDGGVALQGVGQQAHGLGRVAQARADHHGFFIAGARQVLVGGQAEHDLRMHAVEAGGAIERRHHHATGARIQGAARRQHRGAGHAVRAADDHDVAEGALVAVVAARQQLAGEQRGVVQADGRFDVLIGGDAETVDLHLARMIAPGQGVQARLVGKEGKGALGHDGDAAGTDHRAGIGIEPAGHVERQHLPVARVQRGHQRARGALERARQADAEQAVDHQARLALGQRIDEAGGAGPRAGQCGGGVRRHRPGARQVQDGDVDTRIGVRQVGRRFQGVAAVVAGTGQQHHAAAVLRQAGDQGQRHIGGGLAGALHQAAGGQGGGSGALDGADLRDGVEVFHAGLEAKIVFSLKIGRRVGTIGGGPAGRLAPSGACPMFDQRHGSRDLKHGTGTVGASPPFVQTSATPA